VSNFSTLGFVLALGVLGVQPAFSQTGEDPFQGEWVEYQDGRISVNFDQTPVPVALNAIQARTGLQIIIPPVTNSKLLNLRLSGLALEPAVRFLIASIGFKSFALMYDEKGRPERAVVLGLQPEVRATSATDSIADPRRAESSVDSLTTEERDQLLKDLERWSDLKQEDRNRIETRLKQLPASEEREQLVKEYGRQLLGIKSDGPVSNR
jgi:type II secretory pathway component GspD/PulD (secretin)